MPYSFDYSVAPGKKTYIIAEMAWSHNGSLETGLQILQGAKAAGADAIGIHLTCLSEYMVPNYRCSDGQTLSKRDGVGEVSDIYRYLEKMNLTWENWDRFLAEAQRLGIDVCAMCNDLESVRYAARQEAVTLYAIPAACFTEYEFIDEVARLKKPIVLRIGGATLGEIERTVARIRGAGNNNIILLHGIQLYPTDPALLNLALLRTLASVFGCVVGLADHIDGGREDALFLPLLALPYGATVIEKHITLDRALKQEDFEAALGVAEFRRFVEHVRLAESVLGDGSFGPLTPADQKYRRVSRKRVVARHALARGAVLQSSDIAFKRSDFGIDPGESERLIGRTLACDVSAGDGLDLNKVG